MCVWLIQSWFDGKFHQHSLFFFSRLGTIDFIRTEHDREVDRGSLLQRSFTWVAHIASLIGFILSLVVEKIEFNHSKSHTYWTLLTTFHSCALMHRTDSRNTSAANIWVKLCVLCWSRSSNRVCSSPKPNRNFFHRHGNLALTTFHILKSECWKSVWEIEYHRSELSETYPWFWRCDFCTKFLILSLTRQRCSRRFIEHKHHQSPRQIQLPIQHRLWRGRCEDNSIYDSACLVSCCIVGIYLHIRLAESHVGKGNNDRCRWLRLQASSALEDLDGAINQKNVTWKGCKLANK